MAQHTGGEADQPNQWDPVILASRVRKAERRLAGQRIASQATAEHLAISRPEASESEGRLRLPRWNGSDCPWQSSDTSSAPGVVVLCPFAQVFQLPWT